MMPDETFTPTIVAGIATDISSVGLRVKTPLISEDECRRINNEPSFAKLELEIPGMPKSMKLRADIFWARYHPETADERAFAELGFSFQKLDEKTKAMVNDAIAAMDKH